MRVTRSIIPNLFTLANLFCGFGSIIASTEGDFDRAALLILLSGVFDALDGAVARLVRKDLRVMAWLAPCAAPASLAWSWIPCATWCPLA